MLGEKIVCRKGGGSGSAAGSAGKMPDSLAASYGGVACMLDKMIFSKDGKVEMYVDNERQTGTYSMQGNQVTVTGEGGSVVFTLAGDNLEAAIEGQRTVCSKM